MNLTKRVGLVAGAAALTLGGGSFAETPSQANNEQLQARIAELESRLATVEANNGDNWLTQQRADEVRSLVQDVLADADTRASLLAQGMTAGYENGAVISSADGNWLLRTNIHMQQRFILTTADDGGNAGVDDDIYGFENTRTKFILSGNVVSSDWFYKVEINVAGAGTGRAGTGDAYVGYNYGNGWKVLLGTWKAPILREELVDSRYQLAVERSISNYLYTGGRVDGIAVDYAGDQFHVTAGVSDGAGTGQTNWNTQDTDFAFTARAEYLVQGNWEQFTDFTSPNGEERGIMIGGAIHYQTSEDIGGAPDVDITVLTGDVSAEFGGWNLFAALVYFSTDNPTPTADTDQIAFVGQGGYYFNDDWEGFLRYEWSDLDSPNAAVQDLSVLTLGVNRYFAGHNAKWTTDIGFGLDEISTAPSNLTGFRKDQPGEDGQVVLRTQVQIVF